MYRFSTTVIGLLNLLTLLASIPVMGAGLWMARGTSTACQEFLRTPLLFIGFIVLLVSLAGFIGACFRIVMAMWIYLVVVFILMVTILSFIVFGFTVTSKSGGGFEVPGRVYKEYRLDHYAPWMRNRVMNPRDWETIRSCILSSKSCSKVTSWTPLDYLQRDLSPIQSGCCKPPSSCNYAMATTSGQDQDCFRWNNAQPLLCYECDSCKAGLLEEVKRSWNKIVVLNIVVLLFLIALFSAAWCAYQNVQRTETDHPYGENRITKARPRWDYYWWRWWNERKEQIY
ncbi:tetraspanin-6-like isoform X1 [Papaver somniferum]|uniref:tetraspanin-6-like isoform X1 n=1 Tax=Papaver somniferum TaxID=3469 RepID=UPI000E7052BC|nr:tetraspanin-6-like isoform X1 [Papaver somniferum]